MKFAIMLMTTFFASVELNAQLNNVQKRVHPPEDEFFGGEARLGFNSESGNVEKRSAEGELTLRLNPSQNRLIFVWDQEYTSKNRSIASKDAIQHFQHGYAFSERVESELFIQHSFNEPERLQSRRASGIGARLSILSDKYNQLFGALGYTFETDKIISDEKHDAGQQIPGSRIYTYIHYRHEFEKKMMLMVTLFYHPLLSDLNDRRLLTDTSIKFPLVGTLSFIASAKTQHDSSPPVDVLKRNLEFKSSFELKI